MSFEVAFACRPSARGVARRAAGGSGGCSGAGSGDDGGSSGPVELPSFAASPLAAFKTAMGPTSAPSAATTRGSSASSAVAAQKQVRKEVRCCLWPAWRSKSGAGGLARQAVISTAQMSHRGPPAAGAGTGGWHRHPRITHHQTGLITSQAGLAPAAAGTPLIPGSAIARI